MHTESNKKRNRLYTWGLYACAFLIPVLCLLIHMLIGKCWPFGENSILLGDAKNQYFYFFTELQDRIKNGESLLFSWDGGMGYDFYTNLMYYLASPFTLVALCFGGYSMELGMIVDLAMSIGGISVAALYYFRHTSKNRMKHGVFHDAVTVWFAVSYAMCNYILAYQYAVMWLMGLLLAPLVMLGIERIVERNDCRLYLITLFLTFVTNYYFAWFVCILSVLYFIDQSHGGWCTWRKQFVRWAGSSVVSAAAAAAVLVPCYLLVLTRDDSNTRFYSSQIKNIGNLGDFLQSFFWGHQIDIDGSDFFTQNNYVGIVFLLLCGLYLGNKEICISRRIRRICILAFLCIALNWSVGSYFLHGGSYPHGLSNRFAFILTLFLLVTAFESIHRFQKAAVWWLAVMGCISLGAIVCVLVWNTNVQNLWCYMGSFLLLAYVFILLVLYKRNSIKKSSILIQCVVLGFAEMISNAIVGNLGDMTDVRYAELTNADQWSAIYEALDSDAGERKTSWMYGTDNMLYSDTNLFSSSKNMDVLWLFEKLGLIYQPNGGSYAYSGTTPVTAAMFNVRNVLTDTPEYFGGYSVSAEQEISSDFYDASETVYTLENEYLSGLGFSVSTDLLNWNAEEENIFEVQNGFVSQAFGCADVFLPVDDLDVEVGDNAYCLVTDVSGNRAEYYSTAIYDDAYTVVHYQFTVSRDMTLYAYAWDENWQVMSAISMDGDISETNTYQSYGTTICIGDVKKGQNVELYIVTMAEPGQTSATDITFYELDEEKMDAALSEFRAEPLTLTKFEDTCVEGTITISEDNRMLYTSIPDYKGFHVYVDGEEAEIESIGDALIGVRLSKGEHTIRITYFPYGWKLGLLISLFGVVGMALIYRNENKKFKTSKIQKMEKASEKYLPGMIICHSERFLDGEEGDRG